jgi:hypothetical protein
MVYSPVMGGFKLSAQDMGAPDYAQALRKGFENQTKFVQAKNAPMLAEAQINELQGRAQKNLMMSKLLESLSGGGGAGFGGEFGEPNNLKAAVIKGMTGIDPYLRSPEQTIALRNKGDIERQGNKANLTTGSSDVAREHLQGIVSMPKEYSGTNASYHMLKDRYAAEHGDNAAKERLIQAAVAERLVPEYSGFQLMSQGQKATVPALKHQQEAIRQGWPHVSHVITNNLPPELQKEAERRHNEAVKGVNKIREGFLKGQGKRNSGVSTPSSQKFKWSDIQHTAQQRGISENDVIEKLAKKSGVGIDEFMNMVEHQGE